MTTNGPTPALIVRDDRVRRRVDDRDRVLADLRHPDLTVDDVGIAERRRSGERDGRGDGVRTAGRCARCPSASSPRPRRPRRPSSLRRPGSGSSRATLCDAGSTRITPSLPVAQTEPNAPTAPVAFSELPPVHDPVLRRVDALELALRERGRPRRAEGERRVVGREPDLDRLRPLPGRDGDAADRRGVRVLDPHRAGAEAEPARAGADPVFETTLFVARVDLEEVRLSVLADPDPLAAGSGGAGRGGRATRILATTVGAAAVVTVAASRAMSVRIMART